MITAINSSILQSIPEHKQLSQGNYTLTEEQFAAWGTDNNVVNQYVADAIGVTIL